MTKNRFYLLLLTLLFACNSPKYNELTEIGVNFDTNAASETFFTGEQKFIPLHCFPNSFIGDIAKVIYVDNKIYVSDSQYKIHSFDANGNQTELLFRMGKGPQEYMSITDFDVFGSNIFVLSAGNKAIYVYTLTGDFTERIPLDDWYRALKIMDDSMLVLFSDYSNNTMYNYAYFNYKSNEYTKRFAPFSTVGGLTFSRDVFHWSTNSTLLTTTEFSNTLFRMSQDIYTPAYNFNFGTEDQLPPNINEIPREDLNDELKSKSLVKRIRSAYESDSILYILYNKNIRVFGLPHITSLNLKTKRVSTLSLNFSVGKYPIIMGNFMTFTPQGYLLSATTVNIISEKSRTSEIDNPLKNESTTQMENYVIILTKLK